MSIKELCVCVAFFLVMALTMFACLHEGNNIYIDKQTQPPTHYQATCADGIFNGEVIKKGKKYYLDSGQEIWIPLKECVLVEL